MKKAIEEFKGNGIEIRDQWIKELYNINSQIWDLEADIRAGREGKISLEEVGRRTLLIRDLNRQRVSIKNRIIDETGIGFKDVKINHASE